MLLLLLKEAGSGVPNGLSAPSYSAPGFQKYQVLQAFSALPQILDPSFFDQSSTSDQFMFYPTLIDQPSDQFLFDPSLINQSNELTASSINSTWTDSSSFQDPEIDLQEGKEKQIEKIR